MLYTQPWAPFARSVRRGQAMGQLPSHLPKADPTPMTQGDLCITVIQSCSGGGVEAPLCLHTHIGTRLVGQSIVRAAAAAAAAAFTPSQASFTSSHRQDRLGGPWLHDSTSP